MLRLTVEDERIETAAIAANRFGSSNGPNEEATVAINGQTEKARNLD
jgi:hypothetical protein